MAVLVAFECSGIVASAFRSLGVEAYSCDLKQCENPLTTQWHIVGNALEVMRSRQWDLIIAHPPCTYLCSSGLFRNKNNPARALKTEMALKLIAEIWAIDCDRLCIENPVGCINTRLDFMPRPQYIQPYEYGHDASKRTGLWLRGLPPIPKGKRYPGRLVQYNGKTVERWANQTDSGQNRLPPGESRATDRARTYPNIAAIMAKTWLPLLTKHH